MAADKVPNIWDPWLETTKADLDRMFENEKKRAPFGYERLEYRVIKDQKDWKVILKLLGENMNKVLLL